MDYVRISQHENGHWMARVFWKRDTSPPDDEMPNHVKTFKPEDTAYVAVNWARDWYMHADVLIKCSSCNLPYKNGDTCPAIRRYLSRHSAILVPPFGETYDCAVCGKHHRLYYEDMA